ncbi:MAG: carbonic anhydrase [bacterium]
MGKYNLKKLCLIFALVVSINSLVIASEKEETGHGGAHHSEEGVTPDAALGRLKEGNKRYTSFNFGNKDWKAKLEEVYNGQKPYAIILSCSDSRVAPEYIFDAGLGEIFIIRTAGNVVDPVVLGSIEYAVAHLGSKLLIVMGHEKCGAVTAAVNHASESANISAILNEIKPSVDIIEKSGDKENLTERAILENANAMAKKVTEGSQVISDLVKEGKFKIISAKYFLKDGRVEFLEGK